MLKPKKLLLRSVELLYRPLELLYRLLELLHRPLQLLHRAVSTLPPAGGWSGRYSATLPPARDTKTGMKRRNKYVIVVTFQLRSNILLAKE
jgi:hypothetical protein